jgi:hypothetical protein
MNMLLAEIAGVAVEAATSVAVDRGGTVAIWAVAVSMIGVSLAILSMGGKLIFKVGVWHTADSLRWEQSDKWQSESDARVASVLAKLEEHSAQDSKIFARLVDATRRNAIQLRACWKHNNKKTDEILGQLVEHKSAIDGLRNSLIRERAVSGK